MMGGVCVCLHRGMPAPKEWGECSVQHLSHHSGLCQKVVDSPSKNRTPPPPPLLPRSLICSATLRTSKWHRFMAAEHCGHH